MNKWTRLLAGMMILLGLAMMTGCQSSTKTKDVSMYDLQKAMVAADETFPDMMTVNSSASDAEDSFAYISEMDYGKVDGYLLAYSSEGKADEIVVIKVKDGKDLAEAEASLEAHAAGRVSLYKTYDPEQVSRAQGAVIFTENDMAVLIISDQADAVKEAFYQTIK